MLRAASVVVLAAVSLAGKHHDAVRRRLSQTPDLRRLQSPDTYARTADGQYCTGHLAPLTTEATCRAAGEALGLTWEGPWHGVNKHCYCTFANDGRSKLYFNTAGTSCSDTPHPTYQSVCLQGSPDTEPEVTDDAVESQLKSFIISTCKISRKTLLQSTLVGAAIMFV